MSLFGKKGRKIIVDNKLLKNKKAFSDEEIERLQYKANLMKNVSRLITIAVMVIMALYIFVFDKTLFAGGSMIRQTAAAVISVILCGAIANEIANHFVAKRMEGSFWTAYRQQYLVNMAGRAEGIDYVVYKEAPGLTYEEIEASVLVLCKYYNLCTSQDSMSGKIGQTNFCITNLSAGIPRREENGKTTNVKIFKGIMGMFRDDEDDDYNGLIDMGFVQIFSRDYKTSVAGFVAQNQVKSGDEKFDEKFTVYAENPDMAAKLFSRSFKDALECFCETVNVPSALSFNGTTMFAAINNYPDIFEASLDEDVVKQKEEVKKLMEGVNAAKKVYDAAKNEYGR